MPTIKEVARLAGVSIATVSHVINATASVSSLLRARVLEAIKELDYHPDHVARSLKIRRTRMLGVIIPDITNPFFPLLVRGAEEAAAKANYRIIIYDTDDRLEREKEAFYLFRSRRVDGLLLVSVGGDLSHVRNALAAGVPIVCMDRLIPQLAIDSVSIDNFKAARDCTRHLIGRGHHRIAVIGASPLLKTSRDRLRGYKKALREANIDIDAQLIRTGATHLEDGRRLGRELLAAPKRPSAVLVFDATIALGVLNAIHDMGLQCPQDVALATFTDLELAHAFRPGLTAVAMPNFEIGYRAAELLISRLEGVVKDQKPVRIKLETTLKIRESSAGPGSSL